MKTYIFYSAWCVFFTATIFCATKCFTSNFDFIFATVSNCHWIFILIAKFDWVSGQFDETKMAFEQQKNRISEWNFWTKFGLENQWGFSLKVVRKKFILWLRKKIRADVRKRCENAFIVRHTRRRLDEHWTCHYSNEHWTRHCSISLCIGIFSKPTETHTNQISPKI